MCPVVLEPLIRDFSELIVSRDDIATLRVLAQQNIYSAEFLDKGENARKGYYKKNINKGVFPVRNLQLRCTKKLQKWLFCNRNKKANI